MGAHLSKLWPCTGNWAKVGSGHSFEGERLFKRLRMVAAGSIYPALFFFEKVGLACTNLTTQPFYFSGGKRERQKNISGHIGQLSMPQRNVITVFNSCRSHTWYSTHLSSLVILFCVDCARTVMTESAFRRIPTGHTFKWVVLRVCAVCNFNYLKSGHRCSFQPVNWVFNSKLYFYCR